MMSSRSHSWTTLPTAMVASLALQAGLQAAEEPDITPPEPAFARGNDALWSQQVGEATMRLLDMAAITQLALGVTDGDEHGEWAQTGSHDPRSDGFNLQGVELSIAGEVDPYVRAAAYLFISEDHGVELEEAYAVSTNLPGVELEVGLMLMEFGRYNPMHSHDYSHIDQPLVIGDMMGGEGTRDLGLRLGALLPTSWYSELHLSVLNGDNETAISFLGEGHDHGGEHGHDEHDDEDEDHDEDHGDEHGSEKDGLDDMLYAARWVNGWSMGDNAEIQVGLSSAYGPNKMADHTTLLGADIVFKWFNPNAVGSAGTFTWTNEFIHRDVGAEDHDEEQSSWGIVSTLGYDVTSRWHLGLRFGLVDYEAHEEEHEGEDDEDHDEHDHEETPSQRFRVSPLIAYRPSEFTKFRLQYNYTEPEHGDAVHSVWLGLEVLIGTHPAHNF